MKHFEFWPPRLFETLYVALGALRRRPPFKYLAKANYALDHGEVGFGSKLHTQQAFDQSCFLATERLPGTLAEQLAQAR